MFTRRICKRQGQILLGVLFALSPLALPTVALADDLTELKDQVRKLEKENRGLQEQLDKQREVATKLLSRIEQIENREATASLPHELTDEESRPLRSAETFASLPRLTIRGFSDVGLTTQLKGDEDRVSFKLENIDLFMVSELTDRVSALFEADFFSSDTNTMSFGLQRLLLKYALSDLLNIKIGRMHTALGYWNEVFHHGSWLQTTVNRPEIYRFERDEGGFLPVHNVGIELSGTMEAPVMDLGYRLSAMNGRGRTVTEVQHVSDKNDAKAIGLLLTAKPHSLEGFQFGPMVYWDRIPGDPPTAGRRDEIDELILGGHAVYLRDPVEFLAELFHIRHDDKSSPNGFDTLGFYIQTAYRMGKFKPYYRFDYLDVAKADPYFTGNRRVDRVKHTMGVRWDLFSWNALKLEYGRTDKETGKDEHEIALNSSFTF